jgi:plasmid maintenance system antidote protein VapI
MGLSMSGSKTVFALRRGKILKTEFMPGVTLRRWQRRWFSGIFEVIREDRAISANTAVRLEVFRPAPAQSWLTFQNDYDLRLAEGTVIAANSPALARA